MEKTLSQFSRRKVQVVRFLAWFLVAAGVFGFLGGGFFLHIYFSDIGGELSSGTAARVLGAGIAGVLILPFCIYIARGMLRAVRQVESREKP